MKKQAIAVKKNAGTMLLDFDGMIYDSMRIWHPLAKELVLSCGGVPDSRIIESMKLRDLGDYVGFLREQFFLPLSQEALMERCLALLSVRYSECSFKPGAAEFICKARNVGWRLVIATASNEEKVWEILHRENVDSCFDFIANEVTVGIKKDQNEFFPAILERLGVSVEEAILFDDAPYSLRRAKQIGLRTVGVRDPIWGDEPDYSDADILIGSLAEWQDF